MQSNVRFQKISIPLVEFLIKVHTLDVETHLPLRISENLPWSGYGYFLEPQSTNKCRGKRGKRIELVGFADN